MKFLHLMTFILLTFALPEKVVCQYISTEISIGDTTEVHILSTVSGDRLVGRVTSIQDTTVTFLMSEKIELTFDFSEILSVVLEGSRVISLRNRYRTRVKEAPIEIGGEQALFFSPTAFTFGKGNNEYRNRMVIYNQFESGVTEFLDLGVDLLPFIVLNIVALKAKVGIEVTEKFNLGAGASSYFIFINDFDTELQGGLHLYGVASVGTREKFANFGAGVIRPFDTRFNPENVLALTMGGAYRIKEKWKLMLDFIFTGEDFELSFLNISAGWFNNKHRVDFGITGITDLTRSNSFFVPVPAATYARMF